MTISVDETREERGESQSSDHVSLRFPAISTCRSACQNENLEKSEKSVEFKNDEMALAEEPSIGQFLQSCSQQEFKSTDSISSSWIKFSSPASFTNVHPIELSDAAFFNSEDSKDEIYCPPSIYLDETEPVVFNNCSYEGENKTSTQFDSTQSLKPFSKNFSNGDDVAVPYSSSIPPLQLSPTYSEELINKEEQTLRNRKRFTRSDGAYSKEPTTLQSHSNTESSFNMPNKQVQSKKSIRSTLKQLRHDVNTTLYTWTHSFVNWTCVYNSFPISITPDNPVFLLGQQYASDSPKELKESAVLEKEQKNISNVWEKFSSYKLSHVKSSPNMTPCNPLSKKNFTRGDSGSWSLVTYRQDNKSIPVEERFFHAFNSIPRMTYRSGFAPMYRCIGKNGDNNDWLAIQSDVGWGCTIRAGQMVLIQCLLRHFLTDKASNYYSQHKSTIANKNNFDLDSRMLSETKNVKNRVMELNRSSDVSQNLFSQNTHLRRDDSSDFQKKPTVATSSDSRDVYKKNSSTQTCNENLRYLHPKQPVCEADILRWFLDKPTPYEEHPFSIFAFIRAAGGGAGWARQLYGMMPLEEELNKDRNEHNHSKRRGLGKFAGEWFGPATVSQTIKLLVETCPNTMNEIYVYVDTDGILRLSDVDWQCRRVSESCLQDAPELTSTTRNSNLASTTCESESHSLVMLDDLTGSSSDIGHTSSDSGIYKDRQPKLIHGWSHLPQKASMIERSVTDAMERNRDHSDVKYTEFAKLKNYDASPSEVDGWEEILSCQSCESKNSSSMPEHENVLQIQSELHLSSDKNADFLKVCSNLSKECNSKTSNSEQQPILDGSSDNAFLSISVNDNVIACNNAGNAVCHEETQTEMYKFCQPSIPYPLSDDFVSLSNEEQQPSVDQTNSEKIPKWRRSVLLLFPLNLCSSDRINPIYCSSISACLELPWCIGIVGGRVNQAFYYVGKQQDCLLYLDPHANIQAPALHVLEDSSSFHGAKPMKLPMTAMNPSFSIAFYCHSFEDFQNCASRIKAIESSTEYAILSVRENRSEQPLFRLNPHSRSSPSMKNHGMVSQFSTDERNEGYDFNEFVQIDCYE